MSRTALQSASQHHRHRSTEVSHHPWNSRWWVLVLLVAILDSGCTPLLDFKVELFVRLIKKMGDNQSSNECLICQTVCRTNNGLTVEVCSVELIVSLKWWFKDRCFRLLFMKFVRYECQTLTKSNWAAHVAIPLFKIAYNSNVGWNCLSNKDFNDSLIISLSATVHFQHSAELVKLLSISNVNYTLQVTSYILPSYAKCHLMSQTKEASVMHV